MMLLTNDVSDLPNNTKLVSVDGDTNANWYVIGKSSSLQSLPTKLNIVLNSVPCSGLTTNRPGNGAPFVDTIAEIELLPPLRMNVKLARCGKLFASRRRLNGMLAPAEKN